MGSSYSRQDGRSRVEASNVYDLGLNREDIKRVGDGNAILTSSDLGLRSDVLIGNIPQSLKRHFQIILRFVIIGERRK